MTTVLEPPGWKDELTESYSHGMRQKLIISGALVHRPVVIVVDEPMVGLDPRSARLLKDLFRQFVNRGGTVLMSTHTLEVAETMCDRIAIIHGGRIVASGTMSDLQEQTASEQLGLPSGTPVAIGWTDGACAMLGTGCFAAPGAAFGPEGEGYLRWCFAAAHDKLAEGVARLRRARAGSQVTGRSASHRPPRPSGRVTMPRASGA